MGKALKLVEIQESPLESNLALSESIKDIVIEVHQQSQSGNLTVKENLKGHHSADEIAIERIKKYLAEINIQANIHIEGHEPITQGDNPELSIYIDPIDGSLNRDLRVGNPACVIAMAMNKKPKLKDLQFGYVFDLHSGDTYYSHGNEAFYIPDGEREAVPIKCDSRASKVQDAIAYINSGYGRKFAMQEFLKTGALRLIVKHVNSFDNSAMEICQMARGAAHLRVESRSYTENNVMKGSDHANLLAAMTIGRASGLYITDLQGNLLEDDTIDIDQVQDFICCSNPELLKDTIQTIKRNRWLLLRHIFASMMNK